MQKKIQKTLIIVPIMLALCFSFIQAKVYAIDNVKNESSISERNNKEEVNKNLTTTQKDDGDEAEITQNKKTESSLIGTNISDENTDLINEDTEIIKDESKEEILPEWRNIEGKLHYVTEDGIVEKTGWFKETDENSDADNDNEYYLDKDYAATIGWKKIDGNWYYFDEKGVKQSGWTLSDYNWFHLNEDGILEEGWIKDNGYKYYLNKEGKMASGKTFIDGQWYFFDGSGMLQTGIYENNNKQYYSTKDGVMVANEWINIGDESYYVKADSSLAVGDVIINGKMERFDSDGKYIGSGEMTDYLFLKFINVGDADCEYIKLPSGETALIDTGDEKTSDKLVSFLKKQNLNKENGKSIIDYVIITHPHSDHIGGLISVLDNFKVKKVYMPKIAVMKDWYSDAKVDKENPDSIKLLKTEYKVYKDTMNYIKKNKIKITNTVRGNFIDKNNILQFIQSDKDFGPIGSEKILADYWALNDKSAVVYLNYEDLQVLFTGDMEWTSERDFVDNELLNGTKVDVLKVPHHGHNTSSTMDFISYVKPNLGVISRAKESINTESLRDESIKGNVAYDNLISNGVSIYETSEKDGVSIYATEKNWNLGN